MKKAIVLLLLILPVLAGCNRSKESRSRDFTHTGCAVETRADATSGAVPSLLILKYEDGDLRVIRRNVTLNCSIKERGLACSAFVEGESVVYLVDYAKAGDELRCVCPVKEMTSLVTGLEEGKKYTFDYCGLDQYLPRISFTFDKDLCLIKEGDIFIYSEE